MSENTRSRRGAGQAIPQVVRLAELLKEASGIERDLARRLRQHADDASLCQLHREYEELVKQLTWECEQAIAAT